MNDLNISETIFFINQGWESGSDRILVLCVSNPDQYFEKGRIRILYLIKWLENPDSKSL